MQTPDFSKSRYANLFAAPLITHVLDDGPELNVALRKCILSHEKENPASVSKSNQGGWHSETGQLDFCGDAGRHLVDCMYSLADEATRRAIADEDRQISSLRWSVHAWANVNRSGDFNKIHVHPGSTWSGTYYVDTGNPYDAKSGTPLHLFDPCPARSTTFLPKLLPGSVYIHPRPGLMVLFPSYVPHMVFPHVGDSERISIAFNLRAEPFP